MKQALRIVAAMAVLFSCLGVVSNADAGAKTCICVPMEVAVMHNRFHVVCHQLWSAQSCSRNKYLAGPISSNNTAWVAATVSTLNTSLASIVSSTSGKKSISTLLKKEQSLPKLVSYITYDDKKGSGAFFGCRAEDCYRIIDVKVVYSEK
jgi:hypothetical protein